MDQIPTARDAGVRAPRRAGYFCSQGGKLYWCDARMDKIERIDLETGENREVVLSSNNMDMFSVSVFEDFIYWSDRYRYTWISIYPGLDPASPLGFSFLAFWWHPTHDFPFSRTHANGSIKRGCKDNATDSVPLRTGIGVQLKDIKVFNRDRQKGKAGLWARAER